MEWVTFESYLKGSTEVSQAEKGIGQEVQSSSKTDVTPS